jgi:hypothetical protein
LEVIVLFPLHNQNFRSRPSEYFRIQDLHWNEIRGTGSQVSYYWDVGLAGKRPVFLFSRIIILLVNKLHFQVIFTSGMTQIMGKVAPDGAEQAADRGLSLSNKSHPS